MKNSQIIESKLSAKRSKKKSQGKLENTERWMKNLKSTT
jgi:hypothetical protein